jgi:hypothetical protein
VTRFDSQVTPEFATERPGLYPDSEVADVL